MKKWWRVVGPTKQNRLHMFEHPNPMAHRADELDDEWEVVSLASSRNDGLENWVATPRDAVLGGFRLKARAKSMQHSRAVAVAAAACSGRRLRRATARRRSMQQTKARRTGAGSASGGHTSGRARGEGMGGGRGAAGTVIKFTFTSHG